VNYVVSKVDFCCPFGDIRLNWNDTEKISLKKEKKKTFASFYQFPYAFYNNQLFSVYLFSQVDHCFDIFVTKLCETIFTYYKSWAARYAHFSLAQPLFLFTIPWTNLFLY